jgi:hypothetical protein
MSQRLVAVKLEMKAPVDALKIDRSSLISGDGVALRKIRERGEIFSKYFFSGGFFVDIPATHRA